MRVRVRVCGRAVAGVVSSGACPRCTCDPLARPQRASYSLGSYIGANPKSFEPVTDPYVASFLAPQTKGTNLRMAFLRSTKDKAIKKAFDTDAGYGLNFTVASNWKKAAKETIFGKDHQAAAEQPGDPSDEVGGETGRDLAEFEDESDAIWRNPLAGSQAIPAILLRLHLEMLGFSLRTQSLYFPEHPPTVSRGGPLAVLPDQVPPHVHSLPLPGFWTTNH